MGTSAAGEAVPGGGEPLPQLAIGLFVDPPDGLPLVEDLLEPVTGGLPTGRLGSQLLGLLHQGGLAGERLDAGGLLRRPGLTGLLLGNGGELVEPGRQGVDVADDVSLGEGSTDPSDGGERMVGVRRTGVEPCFGQIHLGHQVGEAACEVCQPFLRCSRLPGSDHPLALGGLDVNGAVRVHPSEGSPVAHVPILVLPAPGSSLPGAATAQPSFSGHCHRCAPVRVERLSPTVTIRCPRACLGHPTGVPLSTVRCTCGAVVLPGGTRPRCRSGPLRLPGATGRRRRLPPPAAAHPRDRRCRGARAGRPARRL